MGCWTTIKSFHVKIILLDKQELIQEVQVGSDSNCLQHGQISVHYYLLTADRNIFLKTQFVR